MGIKKRRGLSRLQTWMDSETGQMFLNYAYSWGASIVILGALFKLTHITGADLMLFIGMGTEVVVFFLSGFERPWDKVENDEVTASKLDEEEDEPGTETAASQAAAVGGSPVGGTIIIGGAAAVGSGAGFKPSGETAVSPSAGEGSAVADQAEDGSQLGAGQLAAAVSATTVLGTQAFNGLSPEMEEATKGYVDQLNELTETLKKVAEQSARLTRDSEEMENMNRTLTSINKFYEIQLRSVSTQSNTVDDVSAQTRKLAEQLEELNAVYARMVEALKVNLAK